MNTKVIITLLYIRFLFPLVKKFQLGAAPQLSLSLYKIEINLTHVEDEQPNIFSILLLIFLHKNLVSVN